MTGSPMPDGGRRRSARGVGRVESDGLLTVVEPVAARKERWPIGEDVPTGRTVFAVGRVLRPQDLGLLSSIGIGRSERHSPTASRDSCHRRRDPPAGLEARGLPDRGQQLGRSCAPSCSRDGGDAPADQASARPAGRNPRCDDGRRLGCAPRLGRHVGRPGGPCPEARRRTGRAAGPRRRGVARRAPRASASFGGRPVFLLPGNPVSCLCAYDLFAGRAVRRLGGRSDELPYRTVERQVAGDIKSIAGRVEYVRVIDSPDGVRPVPLIGASVLSSTVIADGFVLVPPDRDGCAVGERVTLFRYD